MVPGDDNKRGGIRGSRHRLLGPRRTDAPARPSPSPSLSPAASRLPSPTPNSAKKRVLFVCIGNSCRSQMAEAFARAYGADVMEARSAGISPATMVAPLTRQVLGERNLRIEDQFPKGLDVLRRERFDVVVNMSGVPVALPGARTLEWTVPDPIGQKEDYYRTVAAQIEGLVMRLILELRTASRAREI
jgi:arsenate reductase